jgi:hypothetical protein
MVDCLTYIIFNDLPKEKEQKIKEWAKEQPNTEYWYFCASRLKEEYGGSFCVVTNYHYRRHKLQLYIYQLWKEYHDLCNMRVELWSDLDAEPDEDYGLDGVIEGEEFNEYFSGKTDEEWQKAWQKEIDEWHKYLKNN